MIPISTDQSNQIDSNCFINLGRPVEQYRGVMSNLRVEGDMASAVARVYSGSAGGAGQGSLAPEVESFFVFGRLATCARLSCILSFRVHVKLYYRVVS